MLKTERSKIVAFLQGVKWAEENLGKPNDVHRAVLEAKALSESGLLGKIEKTPLDPKLKLNLKE